MPTENFGEHLYQSPGHEARWPIGSPTGLENLEILLKAAEVNVSWAIMDREWRVKVADTLQMMGSFRKVIQVQFHYNNHGVALNP